jgi:hypothetical protein
MLRNEDLGGLQLADAPKPALWQRRVEPGLLLGGLQVEPGLLAGGLQVEPGLFPGGLQAEPAPV